MGIKRVLASIVLIPILYVIVWELPPVYFTGLVVVAAVIGQYEFYRMARNRGIRPLTVIGIALGVLVSIAIDFYQPDLRGGRGGAFLVTLCVLLVTVVRLFSSRPVEGAIEDISVTFLGIFYVAMLFGFQMALRMGDHGRQWLLFMYLVIWASDTGAYYIGSSLGKHKLYPKISPKKSVEGLIGGMLAAAGVALLCRVWFLPFVGIQEAAVLGLVLAVTGTLGDLVESLFKRSAGVKDSGSLIPGHGGILDRMDSMLFAAPVLYYYLGMR
jgi:phosphatidate cytidylyltransferase